MRKAIVLIGLSALLVAGCNRDKAPPAADQAQLPPPSPSDFGSGRAAQGERIWVGLLPCSDCQGVDTRLVLRVDGDRRDYLMTETYLGGGGKNSFNRAGTWAQVDELVDGQPATLYILDPDRGGQRFSLQADGALEMLDGDGKNPSQVVAYRLQRL
jgi:copper homeostasis protein (lipoprotein)